MIWRPDDMNPILVEVASVLLKVAAGLTAFTAVVATPNDQISQFPWFVRTVVWFIKVSAGAPNGFSCLRVQLGRYQ